MATLYFHIPFCRRICTYCDFYKVGAMELMPAVVHRMHEELEARSNYTTERALTSIYFGGGTPSLLHPNDIEALIEHARKLFDCSAVEEITLEANPDDLTAEYVAALRDTSIDRLSLGIQSFDDEVLRFMNRRHNASEAVKAVERLRKAGYDNLSIDIIFGIGGFPSDTLPKSLQQAVELNVEHISAYHLTVEERTRLGIMTRRGEYTPISEEQSEADYALVEHTLAAAGYEHYEVSNYARSGYRAKHNSAYWMGIEYLGIGPGAHSFSGDDRRWCSSSAREYSEGRITFEHETLTTIDHLNEYIMTSLRRCEGIDLEHITRCYGATEALRIADGAEAWLSQGILKKQGSHLAIPTDKFLLSDAVIESLFA
jgi:oxygen-independent coproporphyrinogen-3 oxidase